MKNMKNELYMLSSDENTACCSFLLTTASGMVLVIDGGLACETDHFLSVLRRVTGADVPRIDAWILTHPHGDHVENFLEIILNRPGTVKLGRVYFNFPSVEFLAREEEWSADTMRTFLGALPRFAEHVWFTCGGDRFSVGEAEIEMLYSPDYAVSRQNLCNNSSLVFRISLGGKTMLFTGDCGAEASEKILSLSRDRLKADICQMAHHGQNGCTEAFYRAVSPEICLWPTPKCIWENDAGKGYNTHTWRTMEVRGWMESIGVKKHYVAKDGDCVISLDD